MRKLLIPFLLPTLLVTACSVYRIDIQQGNTLDTQAVAKLQEGMTRKQVRFLMGTPLIQDPFHPDRWDYVYTFKPGGSDETSRQHLTVFFSGDTVVRIDRRQVREGTDRVGMDFDPDYPPPAGDGGHSH